jgi:hypothetical protein
MWLKLPNGMFVPVEFAAAGGLISYGASLNSDAEG